MLWYASLLLLTTREWGHGYSVILCLHKSQSTSPNKTIDAPGFILCELGAGRPVGGADLLFLDGIFLRVTNVADHRACATLVYSLDIASSARGHSSGHPQTRPLERVLCLCHSGAPRTAPPIQRLFGVPSQRVDHSGGVSVCDLR